MTKALLIAAPRSGAGKTTLALGLIAAFRRRGLRVRAAKCGPDYIDAGFHRVASGAPCFNLDSWAMPPALLETILAEATSGADLLLIEAAMGLFDGVPGPTIPRGSAAELAARFDLPVLLVLDVAGQAQSAAAEAHGFASFDANLEIAAIVLNRVGSERHRRGIEDAIANLAIPIVGALPRDADVQLTERHLGLVQAAEQDNLSARLEMLADLTERNCDLDGILRVAAPLKRAAADAVPLPPPGQRIALAEDTAFSFVYPHVLSGWRRAGAEIVPFAPLADEPPPETCDCCWLPGGYPELHAGRLAAATQFLEGLRQFAGTRPVHGECGGYMVLGSFIEDAGGTRHAMAGLLSHATSFTTRRLHLGYRQARLLAECALGAAGATLRGHEFHYASLLEVGTDAPLLELQDAEGRTLGTSGGRRGRVSGSFFHAIAASRDDQVASGVDASLAATA